jgi:uncharacterized protein YndB with AHSA1/START domain
MAKRHENDTLSEILKAMSDPSRRHILTLLVQEGPLRVTDIHQHFALSLNAVSKHIKMLERAALIVRRTQWREHLIEVDIAVLAQVDLWVASLRSSWELRLAALDKYLTENEGAMMTELTLTVERHIRAAPQKVFMAWLDPNMLQRFMVPGEGMSVPFVRTDPVVGGEFEIVMHKDGQDISHQGTYLDIHPYERLVFTWQSPYSLPGSKVALTFTPEAGGTKLRLTHTHFVSEEARANHEAGWGKIIGGLASELGAP